ncbi:hypothetical protein POM88_045092 [Heracleum sosnowskyi]|uniref:Cyclin C-terminal domain-containing protein n=1 Tax=Heracleum sosnowskyi TaxID=360622 RepID=A0AAD8M627_9APIA|nr:hypothetical protein POM88_045092 [Heracleum sosnowskyi]
MDVMVPYVAINFFDRVISKNRDPPKVLLNKQENFTLFIISWHSISSKLRENDFDIYKFLLDRKMKFGNQGLMKMEMKILHVLDWKMKQTVPFRFVPYFLHFLTLPRGFTRLHVHKIIVWTQADIRFTKFRPSTVAASTILCVLAKLFPDDPTDVTSIILSKYAHFDSIVKDELAECVEMMQTTYQNKMNSLVIATGLINDGVRTSETLNLVPDEASTAPSGSGKESVEEGSQRHIKETVAEEASEAVAGIHMVPEQSSSPADGQESLEEGAQRQGKESVAEEARTVVGDIQTTPKQSLSPGDGRESPVKQSHRPGKEPVDEESDEAIGKIQVGPKQSEMEGKKSIVN